MRARSAGSFELTGQRAGFERFFPNLYTIFGSHKLITLDCGHINKPRLILLGRNDKARLGRRKRKDITCIIPLGQCFQPLLGRKLTFRLRAGSR